MPHSSSARPHASPPSTAAHRALRLIALFEALKGLAVLAASIGLISLLHHDLHHVAMNLIGRFDLDPDARYPAAALRYAQWLQDANARMLVFLAVGYAAIRLLEAYGLWRDLAWAEWLGALSGLVYIPFEIRHFVHRPIPLNLAFVAANAAVVAFLGYRLWRRRCRQAAPTAGD